MTPEIPPAPLYLIPSRIGETEPLEVLPLSIKKVIDSIDHYIVENEKTTREFIKRVYPGKNQPNLHFSIFNKYTDLEEIPTMLQPCTQGFPVGMISDAGAPAIADPGAELILKAHELQIRVIPLVGPNSITMALMASGLNGSHFTFNGFLPLDKSERKRKLSSLEKRALKGETQIFMETPLQNDEFLETILTVCENDTLLCIATSITSPDEEIYTQTIEEWKKNPPTLSKRPSLFLLGSKS